jgi:hypothetical protein
MCKALFSEILFSGKTDKHFGKILPVADPVIFRQDFSFFKYLCEGTKIRFIAIFSLLWYFVCNMKDP